MTDQRDPLILTISFSAAADGAWEVRWEAPEIGARRSRLAPPYQGAELELVVRALDALHGAGISFSAADAARLAALGLARANGLPVEDMHRRVGRALYRALIADDAGSRALAETRNLAVARGHPLAVGLRFPPDAVELAALLAAWQPLMDKGEIRLREPGRATRAALVDAFQEGAPDVVHYYGNGRYHQGEGVLVLDGKADTNSTCTFRMQQVRLPRSDAGCCNPKSAIQNPKWYEDAWDLAPISALLPLFNDTRLVVLHACQSAMVGVAGEGLLTGVAPTLSAAGAPLVMGMQLAIPVDAAARVTRVLYRDLAAGQSVQEAVNRARQALYVEDSERCWYVPVLYIRSRNTGPAYLRPAPARVSTGRSNWL